MTLAKRKTRFELAASVRRKATHETAAALVGMLNPLAKWVRTITCDNGREFSDHMDVASALGCDGYFARPYRNSDRGLNEHSNGLCGATSRNRCRCWASRRSRFDWPLTRSTTGQGNA